MLKLRFDRYINGLNSKETDVLHLQTWYKIQILDYKGEFKQPTHIFLTLVE